MLVLLFRLVCTGGRRAGETPTYPPGASRTRTRARTTRTRTRTTAQNLPSPPYDNRNNGNNSAEGATTATIMQPPSPHLPRDITLLSFGECTDGKVDRQDKRRDKSKDKDRGGGGGGGLPRGSIDWKVVDCAFCARERCVCGWTTVQQKCMISLQQRGATVGQPRRAAVGQKARQKVRRSGGGDTS